METDPIKTEVRRARRRWTGHEYCIMCLSTEHVEWHHVAGDANDEGLTTPLCVRHHDIATEIQRTQGVDLRRETDRSILEKVGHGLVSIGSFLMMLAVLLVGWGRSLLNLAADLDAHFPAWRAMPDAGTAEA